MINKNKKEIPKDFEKIKDRGEEFYASVGEVTCPYLNEKVIFNAKGKEHLKFKSKHKARTIPDQYIRFKLLKYAPEIVKLSRTVQGLSHARVLESVRSNQQTKYVPTEVKYIEFIAIMEEKVRMRVVIKKIGSAQPYFWSIIPFWRKDKEDKKKQRFHYGNPEED